MKSTLIIFSLALLSIVCAISMFMCQYAEETDFVHIVTNDLPRNPTLSSAELDPYRVQAIVFAPRVKHLNYGSSNIGILLYSEKALVQPVALKNAILRSSPSSEIARMAELQNVEVRPDNENKGTFVGSAILIKSVPDAVMKSASQLELVLTVLVAEEEKEIIFLLEKSVRRYLVTPSNEAFRF